MASTLPPSVREGFDLVGFDPRGVAKLHARRVVQTPTPTTTLRADPTVEYTQEGVDHIEKENRSRQRCADKMGKDFLATPEPPMCQGS